MTSIGCVTASDLDALCASLDISTADLERRLDLFGVMSSAIHRGEHGQDKHRFSELNIRRGNLPGQVRHFNSPTNGCPALHRGSLAQGPDGRWRCLECARVRLRKLGAALPPRSCEWCRSTFTPSTLHHTATCSERCWRLLAGSRSRATKAAKRPTHCPRGHLYRIAKNDRLRCSSCETERRRAARPAGAAS